MARVNKARIFCGVYYLNCSLGTEHWLFIDRLLLKDHRCTCQSIPRKKYFSVPKKGITSIILVTWLKWEWQGSGAATVVKRRVKAALSCEECLVSCVNCSFKITATSELVDCGKCFEKIKVSSCNTNSFTWVILQSETDEKAHQVTRVLTATVKDIPRATESERLLCAPLDCLRGIEVKSHLLDEVVGAMADTEHPNPHYYRWPERSAKMA